MYCSKELSAVILKESAPIKESSERKHMSPIGPIIVVAILGIWIVFSQIHKYGSINSSPYSPSNRIMPKDMMPGYVGSIDPTPFMLGRTALPPDGKMLRARLGISSNYMHHPVQLKATQVHVISQGQKGGNALEGVITNHTKVQLYNIRVFYQKLGTHSNQLGKGQQVYPFLPPGDNLELNIPLPPGVHAVQIIQIYGSRSKHPRTTQYP